MKFISTIFIIICVRFIKNVSLEEQTPMRVSLTT